MSASFAKSLPPLHVVEDEYERLSDVVCASPIETEAIALLWTELLRAAIIKPELAPDDLVRMNGVVHFTDLHTGERRAVRLVYPGDHAIEPGDVSITTTLGAALIGLRSGSTFTWTSAEDGPRTIRVERVVSPRPTRKSRPTPCPIDETLEQSFPASDAPSWTLGRRPDLNRSDGYAGC